MKQSKKYIYGFFIGLLLTVASPAFAQTPPAGGTFTPPPGGTTTPPPAGGTFTPPLGGTTTPPPAPVAAPVAAPDMKPCAPGVQPTPALPCKMDPSSMMPTDMKPCAPGVQPTQALPCKMDSNTMMPTDMMSLPACAPNTDPTFVNGKQSCRRDGSSTTMPRKCNTGETPATTNPPCMMDRSQNSNTTQMSDEQKKMMMPPMDEMKDCEEGKFPSRKKPCFLRFKQPTQEEMRAQQEKWQQEDQEIQSSFDDQGIKIMQQNLGKVEKSTDNFKKALDSIKNGTDVDLSKKEKGIKCGDLLPDELVKLPEEAKGFMEKFKSIKTSDELESETAGDAFRVPEAMMAWKEMMDTGALKRLCTMIKKSEGIVDGLGKKIATLEKQAATLEKQADSLEAKALKNQKEAGKKGIRTGKRESLIDKADGFLDKADEVRGKKDELDTTISELKEAQKNLPATIDELTAGVKALKSDDDPLDLENAWKISFCDMLPEGSKCPEIKVKVKKSFDNIDVDSGSMFRRQRDNSGRLQESKEVSRARSRLNQFASVQ